MTSQEAGQKQQERTSTIWKQRRERWAKWKAMQKDFSLPACLRCGHRFEPENVGQDVCSTRCFRILVLKGMGEHRRKMDQFRKKQKGGN